MSNQVSEPHSARRRACTKIEATLSASTASRAREHCPSTAGRSREAAAVTASGTDGVRPRPGLGRRRLTCVRPSGARTARPRAARVRGHQPGSCMADRCSLQLSRARLAPQAFLQAFSSFFPFSGKGLFLFPGLLFQQVKPSYGVSKYIAAAQTLMKTLRAEENLM